MIKAHQFLRALQRTLWYSLLGAAVLGLLSVGNPATAGPAVAARAITPANATKSTKEYTAGNLRRIGPSI